MKKTLGILGMITCIMLMSCSGIGQQTYSKVRFENCTSDCEITYGLKFGDAEYLGELSPGNITSYYTTSPGSYNLKLRDSNGSWITAFNGFGEVDSGNTYVVYIAGSYTNNSMFWSIKKE